ncbi:MAG: glycoside hydrolase family 95 protein, partial [Verrucomicrobia bacterium]|nr:glycoside hydrolase family 95 protein [Verrucomicrobiota bacterium]
MKTHSITQALGCFDVELRVQWLEAKGDPLSRLDTVIDWEGFRPFLVQVLCPNGQGMRHSGSHRPTFHSAANLPPTHLGRSHSRTMKPTLTLLTALLLAACSSLAAAELPAPAQPAESAINATAPGVPLCLWYRQPATNWNEALPLGNGRLGAMVFGTLG